MGQMQQLAYDLFHVFDWQNVRRRYSVASFRLVFQVLLVHEFTESKSALVGLYIFYFRHFPNLSRGRSNSVVLIGQVFQPAVEC